MSTVPLNRQRDGSIRSAEFRNRAGDQRAQPCTPVPSPARFAGGMPFAYW
jgi:hypothetical protein